MSAAAPLASPRPQRRDGARERGCVRELHLSRRARQRYGLDQSLFASAGGRILADLGAARLLAERLLAVHGPTAAALASPGAINALGLIDELLHAVFRRYRERLGEDLLGGLLGQLEDRLGKEPLDRLFAAFLDAFPPQPVWQGETTSADYLAGTTAGEPHREQLLEELVVLWLANQNPAFAPYRELFDDSELAVATPYEAVLAELGQALAGLRLEPAGPSLLDALRQPIVAAPQSLERQLQVLLDPGFALPEVEVEPTPGSKQPAPAPWTPTPAEAARLLRALDLLAEERPRGEPGDGPVAVELPVETAGGAPASAEALAAQEPQAFTPDQGWMPRLVLLAKNALVWLSQLSRRHGVEITRLDQIPDDELDAIVRQGFTGLWLIGLWRRSTASRTIKRLCGNPEAEASAYAIVDYEIEPELGGEAALDVLAERCARRGLRLASDMVPNHTAIDGRWVLEHPERFVQIATPPYPAYTFEGPDLSTDPRVGIYLEDHYYRRSDAAVVFKRLDHADGTARYLYHGNDGTHLPWNDTAQLDVLQQPVREALIEEILRVVRRFPIVRFDAAMTLARRHHHRLWYPAPGSGGDIPSRAQFGLTEVEFQERMPAELWREVVDRVAAELPDTLLLAEAFWLMETYFVRTLGLHRVYNSAFMHTLRTEDNAKLRELLGRLQRFDRQVLGRFVNFLSNPDEAPAAAQFGSSGKYWAAATLLATMPGMPMFGHGQVEGLEEKYGMEFARPRRDEAPDPAMVERHRREIAPLLLERQLFAGAEDFLLFDLAPLDGGSGADALVFANRHLETRSLVIVHHRQAALRGWITTAPDPRAPHEPLGTDALPRVDLASALGLDRLTPGGVAILTDPLSRLDYLVPVGQLARQGLYVELGAYERRIFLGAHELADRPERPLLALAAAQRGQGLADLWPRLAPAAERATVVGLLDALSPERLAHIVRPESWVGGAGPPSTPEAPLATSNEAPSTRSGLAVMAALQDAHAGLRRRAGYGAVGRPLAARHAVVVRGPAESPGADAVGSLEREAGDRGYDGACDRALADAAAKPGVRLGLVAPLVGAPDAGDWWLRLEQNWWLSGAFERVAALLWLDVAQRAQARRLAGARPALVTAAAVAVRRDHERVAELVDGLLADPASRRALGVNRWKERDWVSEADVAATLLGVLAHAAVEASPSRGARRRAVVAVRAAHRLAVAASWEVEAWSATARQLATRRGSRPLASSSATAPTGTSPAPSDPPAGGRS